MKYRRCPRCQLNYITEDSQLCSVCMDEMEGKRSIFDEDSTQELLCPYCEKNTMGIDDIMCAECREKRIRKGR